MTKMTKALKHVKKVISLFQQCNDDDVQNNHYVEECVKVWLTEISTRTEE